MHCLVMALAAAALCGCATHDGATSTGVTAAVTQPLGDLGLVRTPIPDTLVRSVGAPYAAANAGNCPELATEIALLTSVLGPDVDVAPTGDELNAGDLAIDALGSAVSLPYRGIIRQLSGAERRDRARARAVAAGYARRGFLRGLQTAAHCDPAQ